MSLSNCASQGGYIKLARWGNRIEPERDAQCQRCVGVPQDIPRRPSGVWSVNVVSRMFLLTKRSRCFFVGDSCRVTFVSWVAYYDFDCYTRHFLIGSNFFRLVELLMWDNIKICMHFLSSHFSKLVYLILLFNLIAVKEDSEFSEFDLIWLYFLLT